MPQVSVILCCPCGMNPPTLKQVHLLTCCCYAHSSKGKNVLTCPEEWYFFADLVHLNHFSTVSFIFFSSTPVVQSSLIQNPIVLHTTTALPLPACLSLLPPTLQEVWCLPHDTFPCCFFSQIIRGGGNTCLAASPLEEWLKNRCGLWLAMKMFWCSKLAPICSGNTTEVHPPFRLLLLLSQPANLHLQAACSFPHVWGVNYVTCKMSWEM